MLNLFSILYIYTTPFRTGYNTIEMMIYRKTLNYNVYTVCKLIARYLS